MTQLGFYFDASKCTGCKTCAVACKDKNNLEVGRNFRRVQEYAGGSWKQVKGAWKQDVFAYYTSVGCNHCAQPTCTTVCPTGAHAKRADNGLVLIDAKTCIGCKLCAQACPYGAPQFDEKSGKMTKCDGCIDRLADGKQPSCVESCPQRALEFGDIKALEQKYGKGAAIAPLPAPGLTRPALIVKPPRNARPVGDQSGRVYS